MLTRPTGTGDRREAGRTTAGLAAACLLSLLTARPAAAAGPVVKADGQTATLACARQPATVFGQGNFATFTGTCASLVVRGDRNHIDIALARGAPIDIAGSNNQVRITEGGGGPARVSGSGTMLLAQGGLAPTAAGSVISGDGQTIELSCAGVAVTLDGNHSRFHLHGGCRSLLLRGAGNVVDAELAPAATVRVEGDGSAVVYRLSAAGPAPAVTVLGIDSLVQPDIAAIRPAPPAPPAGVTAEARIMAALQGEVVPDGTRFQLPAAMFQSSALADQGQTALAQISQLIGVIHPAGLRIAGADQPRIAAVQSWLVDRGQVRLPVTTGTGQGMGQGTAVEITILR